MTTKTDEEIIKMWLKLHLAYINDTTGTTLNQAAICLWRMAESKTEQRCLETAKKHMDLLHIEETKRRLDEVAEARASGFEDGKSEKQAEKEGCSNPETCKDIHCLNHGSHNHPHILSTDEKKCSLCNYEFPKEEVERQRKELGGKFRWEK
jgi:hypothetical protein